MIEIRLPGGNKTSCLGLGCAGIVGSHSRAEALRLLDVAYDSGIRHFDVARVYGTGDAEGLLGEFVQRRRVQVTITTKFGIDPLPRTVASGVGKRLARPVLRRSRRLKQLIQRHAPETAKRDLFTPDKARASLETSLRELKAEYVDAFLLHDASADDWNQPDLQETLQSLRSEGLIGAYGTATYLPATERAITHPPAPEVAQFESDVRTLNAQRVMALNPVPVRITHGCFRHAGSLLGARLAEDAALRRAWSDELGANVADHHVLGDLLLRAAVLENEGGVVLFSSTAPARIRRNAESVTEDSDERQTRRFMSLAHELLASSIE